MYPEFPYLEEHHFFHFPSVEKSSPEGIVAVGGNLSPGILISAYSQGIFPWFSEGDPILWWSPHPRCVLFPEDIHISKSMKKILKKGYFSFSFDRAFDRVIEGCRDTPRKGEKGTWLTREMVKAYKKLHSLGYAHSLEVWLEGKIAGGLYGVSLGGCFFGESMFSRVSNASKTALIVLAKTVEKLSFLFIDCQVYTPHLETMGAKMISRQKFLQLLSTGLEKPTIKGKWGQVLNFDIFKL